MKAKLLVLGVLFTMNVKAQQYTQTIRGTVNNKLIGTPISGAIISINASSTLSDTSDVNGMFEFNNVTVGRHTISIHAEGYNDVLMTDVLLNSGKELVLNIQMDEIAKTFRTIKTKAKSNKLSSNNDMATVSAVSFSVEETQKYAAAVNDPARMATSFAGVVGADDGNNTIVIRGNSPAGMLWRMEGIDIPGPNHFSSFNGASGGVSIISAQLLGNSDFYTGAFPAEYGNALSGVFDLRLRKGNASKREYTVQFGLLGLDLASEGPLSKKGGSYLVNYRYSTLGMLKKLGIDLFGSTLFQDLSFNVQFPKSKLGQFSVFGFGGLSNQFQNASKDSSQWKYLMDRYNISYTSNTGVLGITHQMALGKNSSIKNILLKSNNTLTDKGDYYENDYNTTYTHWKNQVVNSKLSFHSIFNHRINSTMHLRAGVLLNHWTFSATQKSLDTLKTLRTYADSKSETNYGQAYAQLRWKLGKNTSVFGGFHSMFLTLNKTYSIEPRFSIKQQLTKNKSISVAYGNHAQIQLPWVYFVDVTQSDGSNYNPNKQLGFSRANHYVLSYEYYFNNHSRVKMETYYQDLYNIPTDGGTFSLQNMIFGSQAIPLKNEGKGKNYGMELTMERTLTQGWYYLVSGSLYNSTFTTGNGKWHDTRFNGNFALSATAGKEFHLKGDKKILGLNFKTLWYGGYRQTPIDFEKSKMYNTEILDESRINSIQLPNYFRTDFKISYRLNHAKFNSIWSLDIQNVSNRKNLAGSYYDVDKQEVKKWYAAPLIPILSYKIEF
jgi:hypothetical protein